MYERGAPTGPRKVLAASALLVGAMLVMILSLVTLRARAHRPVVVTGLDAPRGLTPLEDGGLLIAEVLGGRVLRLDPSGQVTVLLEELPATMGGPGERYPTGVSSAVMVNDVIYYIIGEFRGRGYSSLYKATAGGDPQHQAGGVARDGFPTTQLTNPYDLVPAPDGGFFVSDSGFNAVLHISRAGDVSEYATFADRPNPLYPEHDIRPTIDVVPTGLTYGPDNALYLTSLTGVPYPAGAAYVYRIEDINGDGEAMDAGETTVFAKGFSAATDLAFDEDGSLLVAEFSTDMAGLFRESDVSMGARAPGRLVRWRNGKIHVVAEGLVSPTAVAVVDGQLFVSEEFAGRVTEIVSGGSFQRP